jgi:GNAT superfamily N-acetyltransferase
VFQKLILDQPVLLRLEDLTALERLEIIRIYRSVYTNEANFTDHEIFCDITKLVLLKVNDKLIGCSSLEHDRITWLGIDREYAGQNLGTRLFAEIKKLVPETWVSIGLNYPHVIKAATNAKYKLIRNQLKVERLFLEAEKNVNTTAFSCYSGLEHPKLKKAITFSKLPGLTNSYGHGNEYIQIPLIAN